MRMRSNIENVLLMLCIGFAPLTHACDAIRDAGHPAAVKTDEVAQVPSRQPGCHEALNEASVAGLSLAIYYQYDVLQIDFTPYLNKMDAILDFLSRCPSARLVIEGHTDDRGTNEMNLGLGGHYADSVKNYLVKRGIAASRIDTFGFGEEKPAVPGDTQEARDKNRRVLIRLREAPNQK